MEEINTDLILKSAANAGQLMLESGAETYRVEDTMNRILEKFGAEGRESFVTPTGITVSCYDKNGKSQTTVKRIQKISVDLERISLINDLSRAIDPEILSPTDFQNGLNSIKKRKRYPLWMTLAGTALIGACVTQMLGGSLGESLGAMVAAPLVYILEKIAASLGLNQFLQNALGGLFAVLIGSLIKALGLIPQFSFLVIGTIMILVPGVTITNAIRDTIQGDYLSGIARSMEAIVTASGIAFGAGLAFLLVGVAI